MLAHLRKTLAIVVLAFTGFSPVGAATVTYENVTTASLSYIPSSDGFLSLTYSFLFAPSLNPSEPPPSAAASFQICGTTSALGSLCLPQGSQGFQTVTCSAAINCLLAGAYQFPLQILAGNAISFFVDGRSLRSLVTSTVSFTGPSPVPIPGAIPLFASGLTSLYIIRWRARRKR